MAPTELKDENGTVIISTVRTYGETTHTFVERKNYKGLFMPGYTAHYMKEVLNQLLQPIRFERVDHIVGNQPDLQMEPVVKWYEKCMGFHRFWSVDDKMMHT
jgi:4-hydroxyphenylpyruvate dioxygenase